MALNVYTIPSLTAFSVLQEFSQEVSRHDGERVPEEVILQNSKHQDDQEILQYPNPYSLDPPLVPIKHPGLLFGNPYAEPGRGWCY